MKIGSTSGLRLSRRYVMAGAAGLTLAATLGRPGSANAAGDVTFEGWQGYETAVNDKKLLAARNAKLQTTYINTTEDIITKLNGGGIGSVDLTTLIHQYVAFSGDMGILDAIDESMIPNLAKMHPHFRALDKFLIVNGKRYAVPFTFSSIPLLYNPAVVKQPPTSWRDLLKAEYKGKVAPFPDVMSMIVTWSRVATGTDTPTQLTKDQLDKTIDMMIALKANSRTVPGSLGDITDMFARGEIVMGMGWEPMISWAKDKGVELKVAAPREGCFGYVDTLNIAKDAPNRDLDHALINFAISTDTQVAFSQVQVLGIVNRDAMAKVSNPLVRSLFRFDNVENFFAQAQVPGMFPLKAAGGLVSWDDVQAAYERYSRS